MNLSHDLANKSYAAPRFLADCFDRGHDGQNVSTMVAL